MSAPSSPAPDLTTDKPPRPRRWIPLSLRMFVAMLGLLGVSSVLLIGVPAYRQYMAIREIERAGGAVYLLPRGPTWLRNSASDAWMAPFDELYGVNLANTQAADATLRYVGRLSDLDRLFVENTQITDAGLAHLKGLPKLEWLRLDDTQIGDSGLANLRGLTRLNKLYLKTQK